MASITKDPRNGTWRARYRDPAGAQRTEVFGRKIDAQRFLVTAESAKMRGSYIDPRAGAVTVADYFAQWSQRQIWTRNTGQSMSLSVRSATFADVRLCDVRSSHIEQWVKGMNVAGLAPGTIKTRIGNVRPLFRAAVRDRLIGSDPTDGVRLPRGRAAAVAMTVPTIEQVGAVMAASAETFLPFVALCAFGGLRLGEAAAVQLGDVDFLRRTLAVQRQVQRLGGGQVEIRPPKYGSERTVYLPDDLVLILARHVESQEIGSDPSAWLFEGEGGNPPHQNTVGYWWRKAKKAAGVDGVRLHDLRHFYASGLIAAGCDVVTVQRTLGHKSATTTLGTYSHLWPTAEDRTRVAAADLLASALSGVHQMCTRGPSHGLTGQ